jgi:quercetin dioxygenase-like cupin family protein
MMFVRLYSGQDGQSHFEELDTRKGSTLFSKTHTGVEVVFKNKPPSQSSEWHTAPRRRYLITLSGTVDVGIGDGTVMTFGPGDVFLAEDLTGQGHTIEPRDNWTRAIIEL